MGAYGSIGLWVSMGGRIEVLGGNMGVGDNGGNIGSGVP